MFNVFGLSFPINWLPALVCSIAVVLFLSLIVRSRLPRCPRCNAILKIYYTHEVELPSPIADPLLKTKIRGTYCSKCGYRSKQ